MENLSRLIGNKIRILRNSKELSQEQLANMADVDRTYMNGIENGKRNISVNVLNKILHALDSSLPIFFNDKEFGNER